MSGFATTIGLEMHVELATRTKMFCGCRVEFGAPPNTNVCPVCLGMPGSLPVANAAAIEYAARIAAALGCGIAPRSVFHRKNYFYPDMPKNYQISQYDEPIGVEGRLEVPVDGRSALIGITRVHLEEDTGKSIHVGGGGRIHDAEYSLEDFNRAGTPLVEIVSEPDITSADEARAFATELRLILDHLGVSDVRMEEGSLRFDANISVAPPGGRGVKVEIKNMNSLRSLHRALAYEESRQREVLGAGGELVQETRHWDEKAGVTKPLRTKEFAFDYRYFPEPDLPPVAAPPEWQKKVRASMPELPSAMRARLASELGLGVQEAAVIVSSPRIAGFFEEARRAGEVPPKTLANWLCNVLLAEDPQAQRLAPGDFAALLGLLASGAISAPQAKEALLEALESGRPPQEVVEAKGMRQVSDRGPIEAAVDEVLAANPEVAARVRGGEDKPVGFLVGQVMKAMKGQANPGVVNEVLRERLEKGS